MVREYIGARYVPKFMGIYDVTQNYEALCVVDNGSGTSYITKIPTPANTPLTDTHYWAIYGASSGAIINLQNQINAINADISDLSNQINNNIIIITDSYGTTAPIPGHTFDTFIDIMEAANDRISSYAYSGDGFIRAVGRGTFQSNFAADIANMSDEDKAKVGLILVAAGRNDTPYTESAILTAIANFINFCKVNFVNAKVKLAYIANGDNTSATGTRLEQFNVYKAFKRCSEVGGFYINGSEAILKKTGSMASDYIHPSQQGHAYLAEYLLNGIEEGSISVRDDFANYTISYSTGISGITQMLEYMENNEIHFSPYASTYALTFTSGTFAASLGAHTLKIGNITNGLIRYPVINALIPMTDLTIYDRNTNTKVDCSMTGNLLINSDGEIMLNYYIDTAVSDVSMLVFGLTGVSFPAVYC